MPNLTIMPELGDSVFNCFEYAWKEICTGEYREVKFAVNGVIVTLEVKKEK